VGSASSARTGRPPVRGDRRVQRSRARLHRALVALILERGWDRVRVQDVCARAGVGRSTFYVHFADKEELLIGGLDDVRDALRRRRTGGDPPFGFLRGLIEHADESRRMFRAVIGKRSGLAVQRHFRKVVLELMLEDLEAHGIDGGRLHVTGRYLTGALVELLIWWLEGPRSMQASEVEEAFVRLSAPVLRAARQAG
jgi:AcrR family transcriptional regulator